MIDNRQVSLKPPGEDVRLKRQGFSSEILKRTLKRYKDLDLVLWAWLKMFFSRGVNNSYVTHYLLSYCFGSILSRVEQKLPLWTFMRPNTLSL